MDISLTQIDLIRYCSIPVVAALVGWATNWVALKLTFWPVEFKGLHPWLGWQGIIPRKAGKVARIAADKSVARIGNLGDLADQIGTDVITDQIINHADPILEELVDEVMNEDFAEIWAQAPDVIKQQVYHTVRQNLPYTMEDTVFEVVEQIDELVEIREMVVEALIERPEILNRMFMESGEEELSFIIRSGLYFGGLFGLIQLLVWAITPQAWILPVFGCLVGFATNWLAINIIFRPLRPVKLGSLRIQGMFLRRQKEVAASYSHILASELITAKQIMKTMLHGSHADALQSFIQHRVRDVIAEFGIEESMVDSILGKGALDKISASMARLYIRRAAEPFEDEKFAQVRARQVETLLREKISDLSPEEFQEILRPAFQEDEWTLIFVGASLGLLAGFAQLFFIFN